MNKNSSQHVVLTFIPHGEASKIHITLNGHRIFGTTKSDVIAGALDAIGAEKISFQFQPNTGRKMVEADYPLKIQSAFALVEETEGSETKALIQLINSSILLNQLNTLV